MDHRFIKITGLVVGVPMAIMTCICIIAMFLIEVPAEDVAYGLVRVGMWLVGSAIIGAAIWLFLGVALRSDGSALRIPALLGTIIMTAFPVSVFLLMPDVLFDYLGGASVLYWIFLMCSPCILCISAPMAWRMYDPDRLGKA